MKKLKSNDDVLDRISALPDSLILEILSLLKMRDVVATTLLSKRWKYLWITIPCLRFKENGDSVEIRNFVNRALSLWRGSHLRKFTINFECDCGVDSETLSKDMDLWVLFAKQRKPEELVIRFHYGGWVYSPPQCLYQCSSIRKLELIDCDLHIIGNVQWGCLDSLKLSRCVFSEDVINQVLSSSPQLKTFELYCLEVDDDAQNLSIRSSSLKNLLIYDLFHHLVLTIWAPNLEALKISGNPCMECLLTDVSSLTTVYLDFMGYSSALGEALRQILPAIQHVVSVKLSSCCFEELGVMKEKYSFPPLLNVKLLRIDSGPVKLSELVGLLEVFPKLKMLIIDWRSFGDLFKFDAKNNIMSEANILKSNLLQLRTAEITWNWYKASMFQFIELLLKHATVIEKIVIRKQGDRVVESDVFLAAQKVVSLQRSFPSVELIFC